MFEKVEKLAAISYYSDSDRSSHTKHYYTCVIVIKKLVLSQFRYFTTYNTSNASDIQISYKQITKSQLPC